MVTAIVLAAGTSERMGNTNKLLLKYKGKTVIETTLAHLVDSGVAEIMVVTGHEADRLVATIASLKLPIVYNQDYLKGMTSSIQCGVRCAKESGYMICLSDMFLVTAAEYRVLLEAYEKNVISHPRVICIPRYHNQRGNPVVFSPFYKTMILEHDEMEGCKKIIEKFRENILWVDMPTAHVLQDMDYREDYEKFLQHSD